jgi:hypothetical protein
LDFVVGPGVGDGPCDELFVDPGEEGNGGVGVEVGYGGWLDRGLTWDFDIVKIQED